MQILNIATLLAVLQATHAFNHRHAHIAKRQTNSVNGALATGASSSSGTAGTTSSSSSSSVVSTRSTSSATTSTTTSAQAGTTTSTTAPPGGTTSTPASSIILTGDATLSASGVPALASISSGMPTGTTSSLWATFTPGTQPPIQGAPVLPDTFVQNPSAWPQLDHAPDPTSAEVQEWMKELDGFNIPDIPVNTGTICPTDAAGIATAKANGWWTCGHTTRVTDIVACPDKLTWGVSFDDGPSPWTPTLLNYLAQKKLNATFFVVGSRAIEYPNTLIEEYMGGHEMAVHTWSHTALTTQTNEQIVAELGWTRKAIKTVTGVTPVYMRPPYGDIDDRVRAISLAMGLVPIIWTVSNQGIPFDTNDWRVAGGQVNSVESYETFQQILGNASVLNTGFAVLQHDLFEVTVDLAVGYTLPAAISHQPALTLTSIGQCNKIPVTDMYRETTKNTTFPYPNVTSSDVTGDGSSDSSGNSAILRTPLMGVSYLVGLVAVLISALC